MVFSSNEIERSESKVKHGKETGLVIDVCWREDYNVYSVVIDKVNYWYSIISWR